MAGKIAIRALETSVTTGTATYSLLGGEFGWQTFLADPAISSGDQVYYVASDVDPVNKTGNWEFGIGTITDGGGGADTLTRDTILGSSNNNNAVSWGAGTRNIFGTLPASGFMLGENNLSELTNLTTARSNLGLGDSATRNEGSGNLLDADTVDGKEASAFVEKAVDATISGSNTFSGDQALSGANTYSEKNSFNSGSGRVILPVGTDKWAE